jgi:hypothetical protein
MMFPDIYFIGRMLWNFENVLLIGGSGFVGGWIASLPFGAGRAGDDSDPSSGKHQEADHAADGRAWSRPTSMIHRRSSS